MKPVARSTRHSQFFLHLVECIFEVKNAKIIDDEIDLILAVHFIYISSNRVSFSRISLEQKAKIKPMTSKDTSQCNATHISYAQYIALNFK